MKVKTIGENERTKDVQIGIGHGFRDQPSLEVCFSLIQSSQWELSSRNIPGPGRRADGALRASLVDFSTPRRNQTQTIQPRHCTFSELALLTRDCGQLGCLFLQL